LIWSGHWQCVRALPASRKDPSRSIPLAKPKGPTKIQPDDGKSRTRGKQMTGGGADGCGDCHGTDRKQFFINPKPKQFLFLFLFLSRPDTSDGLLV
jgi:hypothetical protein